MDVVDFVVLKPRFLNGVEVVRACSGPHSDDSSVLALVYAREQSMRSSHKIDWWHAQKLTKALAVSRPYKVFVHGLRIPVEGNFNRPFDPHALDLVVLHLFQSLTDVHRAAERLAE